MKIPVDRVSETPQAFVFEAGADWWTSGLVRARGIAGELVGPLRIDCQVHSIGDDVYLEGRVEGVIGMECSRCLERYRHALLEGFRLVLEPAGNRLPSDPEGAATLARDGLWLSDELEAGWYQGKQIDLGALVVEVVSVAIPIQPLCSEDCSGLCQYCGANLSTGRCSCADSRPQSPFAVLAGLRDGMNQGED